MKNPFFRSIGIWSIGSILTAGSILTQNVLADSDFTDTNVPLDIDLKAPWQKHPFVLDVIEAIAAENPQAYFTTISALTAMFETRADDNIGPLSDREVHDLLLEHAVKTNLLTEDQIPYIDISLAAHRYSALIEAQYQYFDVWSGHDVINAATETCENVLVYNNEASCDSDSVFALKTISGSGNSKIELLPTDRIIGNRADAPIAILYGDLESETFGTFHTHLITAALSGKVQYILRYKPPNGDSNRVNENLTGYGVELNVKRTDYLVIDDRGSNSDDNNEGSGSSDNESSQYERLRAATDNSVLKEEKVPLLGFRAANYILSSNKPFEALVNVSLDFPKYSKSISEFPSDEKVADDILFNTEHAILASGQNAILINGAPAFVGDDSPFDLLKALDRERSHIKKMVDLGFSSSVAADLITKNIIGDALDDNPLQRYDYRTDSLIWLNSVEEDPRFKTWSTDINDLLKPLESMGQLHPIRHNVNSFVFALDFTDQSGINSFMQSMSLVSRGIPIQIGVIPIIVDEVTETISRHLAYLSKYALPTNHLAIQTYLSNLLSQVEPAKAFQIALEVDTNTFKAISEDLFNGEIQSVVDSTKKWMSSFDVTSKSPPLIFANGVILDKVQNLLMEASFIFRRDLQEMQGLISSGEYEFNKKSKNSVPIQEFLISKGMKRRNTIINPPDSSSIEYVDINTLLQTFENAGLSVPAVNTARNEESNSYTTAWLLGDFDEENTLRQLLELFKFLESEEIKGKNLRLKVVPTTLHKGQSKQGSNLVSLLSNMSEMDESERISTVRQFLHPYDTDNLQKVFTLASQYGDKGQGMDIIDKFTSALDQYPIYSKGLQLIFAGRLLNIPSNSYLTTDDLNFLAAMEGTKRIEPVISNSKVHLKDME